MKICGGPVFGIIPKRIWNKHVFCDNENRVALSMYSLLVARDNYAIILDTGFGDKMDERTKRSFGIENTVSIEKALEESNSGLYTGDITHCILSHLHVDHAGGATKKSGDKIVPSFPNAKYYIQGKEFEDAISPTIRTRSTYFSENFEPLYEQGKLVLLDGFSTILPFISVFPVDGHINAMNITKIKTGDCNVYFTADLIGIKEQVHPLWNSAYDYYPLKSEENKVKLLDTCVDEDALIFMPHETGGDFYRVEKKDYYDYRLLKL